MALRQHGQDVHWIEQPAAESIPAGWHDGNIDVATFEPARQSGATVLDQVNLDADVALNGAAELHKESRSPAEWLDARHSDFSALEGTRPLPERAATSDNRRRLRQQSSST
jgi:hypothetical protein